MSGLNNPRGLAFGPEGALYVAEAGKGAGVVADPLNHPDCFRWPSGAQVSDGPSGSISRLWHGVQEQRNRPAVGGTPPRRPASLLRVAVLLVRARFPPRRQASPRPSRFRRRLPRRASSSAFSPRRSRCLSLAAAAALRLSSRLLSVRPPRPRSPPPRGALPSAPFAPCRSPPFFLVPPPVFSPLRHDMTIPCPPRAGAPAVGPPALSNSLTTRRMCAQYPPLAPPPVGGRGEVLRVTF